jgi:hypothetical protein
MLLGAEVDCLQADMTKCQVLRPHSSVGEKFSKNEAATHFASLFIPH